MDLAVTPEQKMRRDTFADLFATQSRPGRVRRAEETGCEGALWRRLAETGGLGIRVAEHGGSALGLLEATIPNFFDSPNNKRIFSFSDCAREPDASHESRRRQWMQGLPHGPDELS